MSEKEKLFLDHIQIQFEDDLKTSPSSFCSKGNQKEIFLLKELKFPSVLNNVCSTIVVTFCTFKKNIVQIDYNVRLTMDRIVTILILTYKERSSSMSLFV